MLQSLASRRVNCWLLVALAAGCDDRIACPGPIAVVIQTPTAAVVDDRDQVRAGVQTDVRVRTTLAEGARVELEVATPSGEVVGTASGEVDASGAVTLEGVTLPVPRAVLRATGADDLCGSGEDEVTVDVLAGSECALAVTPAPRPNAFYAPLAVLTAADDMHPAPGLQATLAVTARAGADVELFEAIGGIERSVGAYVADARGVVETPHTFADGTVSLRAVCRGGGETAASSSAAFIVDTAAPSCGFIAPFPGSSITPAYDGNGDPADGVQLAIAAQVAGADVQGEPVTVTITPVGGAPQVIAASPVDAAGAATASATLQPATTPAGFEFTLAARDHAGNACAQTAAYEVVYGGCEIAVIAPGGPVIADADGNPGNGSQVDVILQVDAACAGRTMTSDCGANDPSGVVPASGALVLRVDACPTSPCELALPCAFHVTTAAGLMTSSAAMIAFDDQGPPVTVDVVQPVLACGAIVTPATDQDPGLAGVQVVARVASAGAVTRALELTNALGTTSAEAAADVAVTLAPGVNQLVGVGFDALGNRGQSAGCDLTFANLVVGFSAPAADGVVGRRDGVVAGSSLTLPVCGTVGQLGAAVEVSVDGGPPVPVVVTGTSWCHAVTLPESTLAHEIVVTATAGGSFGTGTLPLRVDLTPPPPVAGPVAMPRSRRGLELLWTAPADGTQAVAGYLVKHAAAPLTDASFDTEGTETLAGAPKPPGTGEVLAVGGLRPGAPIYVGIASVDAAGNRSAASFAGPVSLAFDQTGVITSPQQNQGTLALGSAIVHGRFNDDELEDVAVSAPQQNAGGTEVGAVYVHFGTPAGLATTPGLIIRGPGANARFGASLAALRRSSMARDDLVIGAPFDDGGHGKLYVFNGGAGFGTGTKLASAANLTIKALAAAPGFFADGNLGTRVAAADVDGDGLDDLIASAPGGGTGGGIVILYGGTITGNVALSDVDTSGIAAVAELLDDPGPVPGRRFGFYLHAVGRTQGPADETDDLVVAYFDNDTTAGDSLYVIRGDGARPMTPGLSVRAFAPGRDVRIDLATLYLVTEWGSQATTIEDVDGDGARDLVISAYRNLSATGQILIVSGDTPGLSGVARTTDLGVVLATINGTPGSRLGALIASHDARTFPDVDGDGLEDLVAAGMSGGLARLFVWFGGAMPVGTTTLASAPYVVPGPGQFLLTQQRPQGPAGAASWVGDINGDGLEDLCWASPFDNTNGGDGGFEVLWDQ